MKKQQVKETRKHTRTANLLQRRCWLLLKPVPLWGINQQGFYKENRMEDEGFSMGMGKITPKKKKM